MNDTEARAAVLRQLSERGCRLSPSDAGLDLVSAGVNSVTLLHLLSALEDEFDIDFDFEQLFCAPVTTARLAAAIVQAITGTDRDRTAKQKGTTDHD